MLPQSYTYKYQYIGYRVLIGNQEELEEEGKTSLTAEAAVR